ncbi:hypothetical protein G5C60_38820 [Streptomyces sp. HC44]|uniref:Secreted protein n=1 Tax=Streptomyces scabichelini TaxID=2711217 RepID=A0A6G4VHW3_9ACTN|nr:hypothetical protein [Streptomyces scabichelini]NGO13394.1 hypothetical protein [Streptomyces scabichelini]
MSHDAPRRLGQVVGITAMAAGLALLPSTASAQEGPISGASYGRNGGCTTAAGTFGWELTSEARNLYRTWGTVKLTNRPSNCTSDVTGAALQRSETSTTNRSWKWYAGIGRGQTYTFSLDDTDVRDVRFRICNVRNGVIDGCGRVQ